MNLLSSSNSTIPQARTFNMNIFENYPRTNDKYDDDDGGGDDGGESNDDSVNLFIHRMKIDKTDIVHDWVNRYCNNNLTDPLDNGNSEEDFKFFPYHFLEKNSIHFSFSFSLRYIQNGYRSFLGSIIRKHRDEQRNARKKSMICHRLFI